MYETCRHIMPSGLNCQSPAMRGSAFCYFHGRRTSSAPKQASSEARIDVSPVLDVRGINNTVNQILQGLGNGSISPRRASVLLYGLQIASGNPSISSSEPAARGSSQHLRPSTVSLDDVASMAHSMLRDRDSSANRPKP